MDIKKIKKIEKQKKEVLEKARKELLKIIADDKRLAEFLEKINFKEVS